MPAPAASGGEWSPSIPARPSWLPPAPASGIPPGGPTTGPPGPRSSKLAHLLRRRHGGRRARVRGLVRVAQDFRLLAGAVNLARFAALGLHSTANGWQVQPA
jgi:hypothetical protein